MHPPPRDPVCVDAEQENQSDPRWKNVVESNCSQVSQTCYHCASACLLECRGRCVQLEVGGQVLTLLLRLQVLATRLWARGDGRRDPSHDGLPGAGELVYLRRSRKTMRPTNHEAASKDTGHGMANAVDTSVCTRSRQMSTFAGRRWAEARKRRDGVGLAWRSEGRPATGILSR